MQERSAWIEQSNGSQKLEPVTVIERNGNLTLVKKQDGTFDWLAPVELEK